MPRLSKIGAAALAAFGWTSGASVTASYLQVAGGGGGAGGNSAFQGGGGGAGGLLTGTTSLNPTLSYTVTVGAGGVAGVGGNGTQGSNSQFGTLTASVGGGYGANRATTGGTGGSGGGGGDQGGSGSAGAGGSATSGQGNTGGNGASGTNYGGAGGGGGAGAVGSNASTNSGGNGGAGSASSITGTSVTYAGGGGGGGNYNQSGTGGTGGSGGGGTANQSLTGSATSGTANTGGGGGGSSYTAGSGGSGVVIISYPSPQKFGGGIVTTSGSNTIHTFTTSGTLSPLSTLSASYLIVAGGAGGGYAFAGGGGAGGLLSGSGVGIDTNSTYLVTVGAGGAGSTTLSSQGVSGGNSLFSMVTTTAVGGGGGGCSNSANPSSSGVSGGSGGGAAGGGATGTGGSGTSGQGNAGGASATNGSNGGGGAGAVGGSGTSGASGNGGVGLTSSISGTSTYYAGGGGGAATGGTAGTGGNGGGGAGGTANGSGGSVGTSGTANTGGGGGGGGGLTASPYTGQAGGNGGSGIIIISYAGSSQQMAGGTVTISGGNVIHTFTSSGYLTPLKYVGNSLRFRSSASANLTRQPTTSGSQTTATYSFWMKRGKLGVASPFHTTKISSAGTNATVLQYNSSDQLNLTFASTGGTNYSSNSNAVYRDPAAWYHVVVAVDTTQASSANRLRAYVNGVEITSWASSSIPPQSTNLTLSLNTLPMNIGTDPRDGTYYDGYMSEINFIDGQQLTPNSFGTFNSYGVWQPITYGGSYGTNGFYLPFNGNQQGYTGIFNGSSQYLSLTSTSALVVASSTAFTLECFVNFNNFTATTQFPSIFTFPSSYQLYVNSSGVASFYNGTSDLVTGTIGTGGWNHIAVSRDTSGNLSMWINGVRTSTTTGFTASFGSSSGTLRIASYNGTGGFVNGYLSNIRFVNGSAVYSPSSTSITVPITTLTAVTNTALLTCQNATFVDNSTNAFSITNNGTATTAQTYPMSYNIQYDRGPSGNNWLSSGISYTTGSTLDIMTDVPTLTSTTAANYCTLNPLSTTSTLANGNLTYSSGSTFCQSTQFAPSGSGKFYIELVVSGTFSAQGIAWGIIGATANMATTAQPGVTAPTGAYSVYSGGGLLSPWINTAAGTNASNPFTVGQTWQIAIDVTNGYMWLGQNNTWYSSAFAATGNPSTGANPTFTINNLSTSGGFGVLVGNNTAGGTFNLNFGQQPWTYTPPTGFLPLNTYNL